MFVGVAGYLHAGILSDFDTGQRLVFYLQRFDNLGVVGGVALDVDSVPD